MKIKKVIENEIKQNLNKYYPEEVFSSIKINKIKRPNVYWIRDGIKLTKGTNDIYLIELKNERTKKLFIKLFDEDKKKQIDKIKKLGEENFIQLFQIMYIQNL